MRAIKGFIIVLILGTLIVLGEIVANASESIARGGTKYLNIKLICVVDKFKYYDEKTQTEVEIDLNFANVRDYHIDQMVIDVDLVYDLENEKNSYLILNRRQYNYIGDSEEGDFAIYKNFAKNNVLSIDVYLKNLIYAMDSKDLYLKCAPIGMAKK